MTLSERLRRPATIRMILVTAGVFGWIAFVALVSRMYAGTPPGAGFDLELLIAGGRHVAAGTSPYAASMLAGRSVEIATLFYSYPPLVAQAFALLSFLPSGAIFAGAIVVASAGAVAVGGAVAATVRSAAARRMAVLALATLLPFWFPYTVGMLFGNIDIFFPALYGLVLIAVIRPPRSAGGERWVAAGGIALAVASLTKLHPAVLGLWLLARGLNERSRGIDIRRVGPVALPRSWRIAAVAIVAVVAALGLSLAVGGVQPWLDYATVLRAGASVNLLDPRNLGPAVQLVMLFGLGPSAVGPLQVAVLAVALVVSIVAALRVDDPLESLAWAAVASFVVLPVTWFHHFAGLIPFGVAAVGRGMALGAATMQRLIALVVASFAVGIFAFGQPPTWLLVPLFLAAARISRPAGVAAVPRGVALGQPTD